MKAPVFELPDTSTAANLLTDGIHETSLKPESRVYCINRGRKVLPLTFNGEHREIPPGLFLTEYRFAQHAQAHLIVPGTRNVDGGFIPWIAILGNEEQTIAVDPPESCVPFTDEELQGYGESIEGLAPRDGIVPLRVATARAMSRSQGGGGMRPSISTNEQFSPAAAEAAVTVFEPPAESETRAAAAELAAEPEAGASPAPRPMRRRG